MTKKSDNTLRDGYAAFISYRHHDNSSESGAWASWLQNALENYIVPPSLVGELNYSGEPIPDRIYPVFRDETSIASSPNLKAELHQALSASAKLIVICTPSAAQSPYIDEEIRFFKATHGAENVLGVVVNGDPARPEGDSQDCQPRALRYKVTSEGDITSEPEPELLFPDFRAPDGSYGTPDKRAYARKLRKAGRTAASARKEAQTFSERVDMMRLKVIAGILDVPLDDLLQREQLYQSKRRKAAEREGMWLIAAILASPLLIAATFEFNDAQRKARFSDLDPNAPLTQFADLIYAQMKIDTIVTSFFIGAGLLTIITLLVRKKLGAIHVMGAIAGFLFFAAVTVGTIEYFDRRSVALANTVDQRAAQGDFIVEPCAPNLRALYDPVRDEPAAQTAQANACPDTKPRGAVQGFWRNQVGPYIFGPISGLILTPLILLFGIRLFRRRD